MAIGHGTHLVLLTQKLWMVGRSGERYRLGYVNMERLDS
jgi:hypothetical protein